MAMKDCLYCGASISEQAYRCPKCNNDNPFDQNEKTERDKAEGKEKEIKAVLSGYTPCKECGARIRTEDILYGRGRNVCMQCGYPDNTIPCGRCDSIATSYSVEEKIFVCDNHIQLKCNDCGKTFYKGNMIFVPLKFSGGYELCLTCARKYSDLKDARTPLGQKPGCLSMILLIISTISVMSFFL